MEPISSQFSLPSTSVSNAITSYKNSFYLTYLFFQLKFITVRSSYEINIFLFFNKKQTTAQIVLRHPILKLGV
ncbi:hypothetical protein A6769_17075 [Nostoc punctiforme NIES-2108]|uniref:Uncharacterized protein n=1 Tax=Nostoc punctiforme NIES-2108 TaxID=1356359 RepID=A0A367RKI8_NOSPU|nr:hypothetical protein A6769_17075 [Nostoc punctiforme NIES-2108]